MADWWVNQPGSRSVPYSGSKKRAKKVAKNLTGGSVSRSPHGNHRPAQGGDSGSGCPFSVIVGLAFLSGVGVLVKRAVQAVV